MLAARIGLAIGFAVLTAACGGGGSASVPAAPAPTFPASSLPKLSATTPYAANCDGTGTAGLYLDAEVEPHVTVDPSDPGHLIASWQQDRWSTNGGAHGVLAAVSFDAGSTWAIRQAPLSVCSGGAYQRATDPWVSIAPDGHAFWMALSYNVSNGTNAMLVSRSTDGGDSWQAPVTLKVDGGQFVNDKNAVTADPTDAMHAYAVWDRLDFTDAGGHVFGPTWFSRTTDGGDTWETARVIYDPGADSQTIGNQIVVLPDGTLINLFANLIGTSTLISLIRSTDHGATWSAPIQVAEAMSVGAADPQTGHLVRDSGFIPWIAVGPAGALYVVWQDSRFSSGARDAIALSTSTDGGLSWSAPVAISGNSTTQAFTPVVAVTSGGVIGVAYYDFRDDTSDASRLLTGYWFAASGDGLTWTDRRIDGPFDLNLAPNTPQGWFVGDYAGLVATGTGFRTVFAQVNPSFANRTDIYTTLLPEVSIAKAGLPQHRALAAPEVVMTPAWRARIDAKTRRATEHPKGTATPTERKR